jgi:hypothetical protein
VLNPEETIPFVGRRHCGLAAHHAARVMRCALAFTAMLALAALSACGDDNPGSSPTADSASSAARPTVNLQASPAQVSAGQKVTLQWTASYAQSCSASGGWKGTQPTSGVQSMISPQTNTSYTLTCTGQGGSTAQSASVTVYTPAPPVNSPDGSSLLSGSAGSLLTSAGTWTFSTSTGSGGNLMLLNGSNANGGSAVQMLISNGGKLYALNREGNWYEWSNSTWVGTTDPSGTAPVSPAPVSPAPVSPAPVKPAPVSPAPVSPAPVSPAPAKPAPVSPAPVSPAPVSTAPIKLICASAVVVGIQWSAATSATSYSISRNGKSLGSTALLTYTDQTVTASTAYTYVVETWGGTTKLSTQTVDVTTPAASANGDAAYCPSAVISGMTWNWSTGFNQQNASDLWPATWGADGKTYFFWGDGQGFFGSTGNNSDKTSFGIGELAASAPASGTTPALSTSAAINLYGGTNPVHPSTINGKANGLIAIGSNFYALGGIYETQDGGGPYGEPNHFEIIYSTGNAYSWVDNGTNWQFCGSNTSPAGFCPISFVNFGPGNADAIDEYVYLLGATEENFIGNGGSCGCTYLARVPNNQLLTKSAYEVYTGIDASGTPQWSSNWSEMQPIFVDNGPRPLPIGKVVYNSALKRFIGVGQGFVNQDAFYDAPNPWGPWTSIGYYNSNLDNTGGWGNLGTTSFEGGVSGDALGINFINAWTSSDGLTMWAAFSSDGNASSGASLKALQGQRMDSFSLVSVRLDLAP